MKNFFSTHNRALKAEWLKLHHSGMLWFCIAAAAFIPAFHTVVSFFESSDNPSAERGNEMIKTDFEIFTPYFFPVFLVIVVVRLVYMEHKYDTLKLIETQPVSKAAIYFSKWEIAVFISFCCLSILLLVSFLGGLILQYGRPVLGFDQSAVDWAKALHILTRFWIASLCIISAQYCITVLMKSFALPMSIGLVALFAGAFAIALGYCNWWPYAATEITAKTYDGALNGSFFLSHEIISVISSILFLWLGYRLYTRKSFKKAFLSPIKNLPLTIVVISAFALVIAWVNEPVVLDRYSATVIAGEIESDDPVKQVLLLRAPMMDTVVSVPVTQTRFHLQTEQNIPPGIYFIKAGSQVTRVFMGNKDSTYMRIKLKGQKPEVIVSGTRVAENDYLQNGGRTDMDILKYYASRFTLEHFSDNLIEYYDDGVRVLETFKTNDRIKPADDFIQMRKKVFATQVLELADGFYPKIFASYFPNQELRFPADVNELRNKTPMNSPEILTFPEYRKYVSSALREKAGKNDSVYYSLLKDSLKDVYARDVMMYESASASVLKIKDSLLRSNTLNAVVANMQTPFIKAKLLEMNRRSNSDKPAPEFTAETLNGKRVKRSELTGKYLIIQLNPQNCKDCKKQDPAFEAIAEKYTSTEAAFISLSSDDKKSWLTNTAAKKSTKVLQLLLMQGNDRISNDLRAEQGQRFMLIDPNGNIIYAKLPDPSEPEFENIIRKELERDK
jgi:peroxiredoxin